MIEFKTKKEITALSKEEIETYIDSLHWDTIQNHVPEYCPYCGASFNDGAGIIALAEIPDGGKLGDTAYINFVFECYCDYCKWSGFICPDELYGLKVYDE